MTKDPQSRKWQLTINNPDGFTNRQIRKIIEDYFCSAVYYCMANEQGEQTKTLHTHLYILFSGGVRFSTIKKHFPTAHMEAAKGSSKQNRDYVAKEGIWENNNEKSGTKIPGTFEEWGEMPEENQGIIGVEAAIIERIQDGATNAEVLIEFPHMLRGLRDVEYVRQTLRAEEYRDKWRNLEVAYIWGETATGKTRFVMDSYGYSNVYAVNNYKHPFDGYAGESVMLFDEFHSSFRIQDMNNYLDGYPLSLPARYSNKQACFEKVFIVSNLDLRDQYTYVQMNQPEVWAAFIRRIHKVTQFNKDGSRREYKTHDYLHGLFMQSGIPGDIPELFTEG